MSDIKPWEAALLEFLAIYSPTDHETAAGAFLEALLRSMFPQGIITTQEVAPHRRNIYCRIPNTDNATPLILTSHYDTVPGELPVSINATTIFGRGACDAKGQIIAQIWGAHEALQRGHSGVTLCFVVGEETDALGARMALDHLPDARYLINGEPTGNKFVRLSWGAMDVKISFRGVSHHSSLGTSDSAIHAMVHALGSLERNAPDTISINIGLISGGSAANTTAPSANARLCVRYSVSTSECQEYIKSVLPEGTFEFVPPLEPLALFVPEPYLKKSIEVRFGSDSSIFVQRIPHVMMRGPGSIHYAHTDQEQINRQELQAAITDLAALIPNLLKHP